MNVTSRPESHNTHHLVLWLIMSASMMIAGPAMGQVNTISILDMVADGGGITIPGGGNSMTNAGDVNQDGYPDIVIGNVGINETEPQPLPRPTGGAYVVFGGPSLSEPIDLDRLDGTNGFRVNGIDPEDFAGAGYGGVGDFNNDGIDDIALGASQAMSAGGERFAGEAYVVFGQTSPGPVIELSQLNGRNGVLFRGFEDNEAAGQQVGFAGDINRDGIDDLFISAVGATDDNGNFASGKVYVVFGRSSAFDSEFDLLSLDGSNGFVLVTSGRENLGSSISPIGDFNNDGIEDFIAVARIASAPGLPNVGISYVIFGRTTGFPARIEVTGLDGNDGFAIVGVQPGNGALMNVADAGDLNGDGYPDIVLGYPGEETDGLDRTGGAYVVFGGIDAGASLDLGTLDGNNGFRIASDFRNDKLGASVDGAGDVNNDGYDDIVLGASSASVSPNPGSAGIGHAYVLFGGPVFEPVVTLSRLTEAEGFRIEGIRTSDGFGRDVSGLGDINADGIEDFYINAVDASRIVFGRGNWIGAASPSCGKPDIDSSTDQGIFLWQDCPDNVPDGNWHLLAAAGGQAGVTRYDGVLQSTDAIQSPSPVLIEPTDALTAASQSLAFVFRMLPGGVDGVDWMTLDDGPLCLSLTENPASTPLYLGAGRQRLASEAPVDINSGNRCTVLPPLDTCGRPDQFRNAGLYLWQDCALDRWHMAAVSDGTTDRFDGTITASATVSDLKAQDFESSDSATQSGDSSIGFDMRVTRGGADRLLFTSSLLNAGDNALCLRLSSRTTRTQVFVGAVRTPRTVIDGVVDVLSSDRCAGSEPLSVQ